MVRKLIIIPALLLFLVPLPALGAGEQFSADYTMVGGGRIMQGKVFRKGAKIRNDLSSMGFYTIIRPDRKKMYMVNDAQRQVMVMPIRRQPFQVQKGYKMRGEMSRKLLGRERVSGYDCRKYEVKYRQAGRVMVIYQWMSTRLKVPVQMQAKDGSFKITYRNIKLGGVKDSMFEPPAGYRMMQMPTMPGGGAGS